MGQRVVLARNLLATLRGRELAQAAKDIAAETGPEQRPVADGQHVPGIYRSLVPWKPVIEQRPGQQLAVTVRCGSAAWEIGRQRGTSIK